MMNVYLVSPLVAFLFLKNLISSGAKIMNISLVMSSIDLEQLRKMNIWLQDSALIQPTTSLGKILKSGPSKSSVGDMRSPRSKFSTTVSRPTFRRTVASNKTNSTLKSNTVKGLQDLISTSE